MPPNPSSPEYLAAERRYAQSIQAERNAWEAARSCLPGSDSFDPQMWARWQSCVAASGAARMALLDTIQVRTLDGSQAPIQRSANDPAAT